MTEKNRLQAVMRKEKTDRPPCICPGGMMNMVTEDLMKIAGVYLPDAHIDSRKMADLAKAVYENGCFENVGVPFCMTIEAEEMGAVIHFGSSTYEPHVVKYAIDSVEEYKKLQPLSEKKGRINTITGAIRILKQEIEGVPIVGNLTGPVSIASSVLEPVTFYKELRKKNIHAHAFMEWIAEQMITFGKLQIEAGADVIAISDPSGTGEILGPKYFKEFAVTYINRVIKGLRDASANTGIIVHICGQMSAVYEELSDVLSDVLSFDSVVPMKEARKHLGNRILMGNVSTYAIEYGDVSKVKALTEHCVKSGSDILSPACGLGMRSPINNVKAILEYLKEEELQCRR